MGQNQAQANKSKNINNLTLNEQLANIIKEEIKPIKTRTKKGTRYLRFTHKRKVTKKIFANVNTSFNTINENSDNEDEIENEISLKNITDLIDVIYTKNINTQLKHRANKSLYESLFDLLNMIDFN